MIKSIRSVRILEVDELPVRSALCACLASWGEFSQSLRAFGPHWFLEDVRRAEQAFCKEKKVEATDGFHDHLRASAC